MLDPSKIPAFLQTNLMQNRRATANGPSARKTDIENPAVLTDTDGTTAVPTAGTTAVDHSLPSAEVTVTSPLVTISEWTPNVEQVLGKWQTSMRQKGKLHCIHAKRLRKYDACCTLPMYALGTATSSFQLILSAATSNLSPKSRSDLQVI
jgi:hypothetical protein